MITIAHAAPGGFPRATPAPRDQNICPRSIEQDEVSTPGRGFLAKYPVCPLGYGCPRMTMIMTARTVVGYAQPVRLGLPSDRTTDQQRTGRNIWPALARSGVSSFPVS